MKTPILAALVSAVQAEEEEERMRNTAVFMSGAQEDSDPIGDALRADAKAYWKFDDASNGARIDSTGRGNTLTDVNTNVGSVAGKISNAAQFTGTVGKVLRINSNADVSINALNPFYLAGWSKLNIAQISGSGIVQFEKGLDSTGEWEYRLIYYHPSQAFIFANYNAFEAQSPVVVADATWYFLEAIYNPALGDFGQIGIAVNGEAFTMANCFEGGIATFAHPLHVGNDDDDNFIGAGLIDEGLIMHRLPTVAERPYLFNAGAGRTLYP